MDQSIITKKIILVLGFLIVIFNLYDTFVHFINRDLIIICNEKSGATVVVKSKEHDPIIATKASGKDALSCIGKSTPYYSRVIEKLISIDSNTRAVLDERYTVKADGENISNIEIDLIDDLFFIYFKEKLIVVGSESGISPFTVANHTNNTGTVYMPENSPRIDALMKEIVEAKGMNFNLLKKGEISVVKSL